MDDKKMSDLVASCWRDPDLKKRLIAEPKKVLAEYGVELPKELEVQVVENTDTRMYLVLPPPPAKSRELSDDQLDEVSGGAGTFQLSSAKKATPVTFPTTVKPLSTTSTMLTCSTGKECIPH